jgi:hypothetical protein
MLITLQRRTLQQLEKLVVSSRQPLTESNPLQILTDMLRLIAVLKNGI